MVIEDLGCFCFLIFTQNRSPTVFKKLRVYDFIREEEGDQAGAVKVLVFFISGNINLCASKGRALCAHERERERVQTLMHHGGQVILLNAVQLLSVWRLEAAIISGCCNLC